MPLKIVHCLRAPVGGLFRHVFDLASGQAALGHQVGVVCDARSGDALSEEKLDQLSAHCALGLKRFPMSRQIALSDVSAAFRVRTWCGAVKADIVHGHGAKGGAYGRFAAMGTGAGAFYTPHGGSLHYSPSSPAGFVFLKLERLLSRATDGLIFESAFGRDAYAQKVGTPHCPERVIHNGLAGDEFAPAAHNGDAADFLFIGELRDLKGVDVLLGAMQQLREERDVRAVIVGAGPEADKFRGLAASLGLGDAVRFPGALPARQAFALGRTLVVPSRAESFPYILLEAIAARVPVITTNVGGIPEIFGPLRDTLLAPGDSEALAEAMKIALDRPHEAQKRAESLHKRALERFPVSRMVMSVLEFYRHCAVKAAPKGKQTRHLTPAE